MSPWFSPPKANALPDGTPEAPRPPSDDALCVIVARPKNKPTITVRQISGQMFDAISLPECVQNELWTACKRRRVSAAFSGKPKAALITVFWQRNAAFELGGSSLPGRGIALADWGGRRLEAVQRASRWRSRMHLALSLARGDIMLVHMQAGGNALQRLGVQLSSSNTICAVLPNSPAERAGLQRGDQVEAVNGRLLAQHKDGRFPRSAPCEALGSVLAALAPELVALRVRLHYSTANSRTRLLEAKALARASRELCGDFDFSLVGRRLGSYHSPPSAAVSEAAGAEVSTAVRDAFLARACERLQRHGSSANHLPPKLREWLRGAGGRAFIDEQRSILQGLEARDTHAREMAWLVRVVQIQLRERAPQVLRKDVGADELTPLLEQVVVATQPQHGWQVRATLQALDGHTLLLQPNLAAAVDGWEVALAGVEGQAIDSWRGASCEAAFWSTVVAHARCCASREHEGWAWLLADCATPLPTLAAGLLQRVAKAEVAAWNFAPPDSYLEVLQDSVCALVVSHSHSLPADGEASSHNTTDDSSPLSVSADQHHSSPATSRAVAAR